MTLFPTSAGAAWQLVFVVYQQDSVVFCRYQIKRWHVPHFLAIAGIGPEVPQ